MVRNHNVKEAVLLEDTVMSQNKKDESLEKGDIFFLYGPSSKDLDDLYIVLKPKNKDKYRSIVLNKKKDQSPKKYWGFIRDIESQGDEEFLNAVSKGNYEFKKRDGRTHLLYSSGDQDKDGDYTLTPKDPTAAPTDELIEKSDDLNAGKGEIQEEIVVEVEKNGS